MSCGDQLLSHDEKGVPLTCELVKDDTTFAQLMIDALYRHMGVPPRSRLDDLPSLQGNLCEFCAWELGEIHWTLYHRKFSKPANAHNPWTDSSKPGIDILVTDETASHLLAIEVKSSEGDGHDLVNSSSRGLKGDFQRLFGDDGRNRLATEVMAFAAVFKYQMERVDLAEKLVALVGISPEESPQVRLIGVLVCIHGDSDCCNKRLRAFESLHDWLTRSGDGQDKKWKPNQCKYYTVELKDLKGWIGRLLAWRERQLNAKL